MTRIYKFIAYEIAAGNTVLAYDRNTVGTKTKHIKSMDRVKMVGGALCIDGMNATGWTICRRP